MSPELDEQLVKRYPMLYSQRGNSMTETCMCWGFECGDGWHDLIDELSASLESINEEIIRRRVSDARWGLFYSILSCFCIGFSATYLVNLLVTGDGARHYFLVGLMAILGLLCLLQAMAIRRREYVLVEATQVKEKFGSLRFYIQMDEEYAEEVEELIDEAERKSAITCESCGKPGRPNKTGWITTLCDDCRRVRLGTDASSPSPSPNTGS